MSFEVLGCRDNPRYYFSKENRQDMKDHVCCVIHDNLVKLMRG
jgi:hypothetical protein